MREGSRSMNSVPVQHREEAYQLNILHPRKLAASGGLLICLFFYCRWELRLLAGLLAMLGNNLPFQAFVSLSGYFLVDNFISHVWKLLIESLLSNSIAYQKEREKGGFLHP